MRYALKFLLVALLLPVTACTTNSKSYREITDPNLRYIAVIKEMRTGYAMVIYNPVTCREIGPACGFFRSHAYAHQRLNHTLIDVPSAYPPLFERQADCWAAKYASDEEVQAALVFFGNQENLRKYRVPGDAEDRAATIRECARQAQKPAAGTD